MTDDSMPPPLRGRGVALIGYRGTGKSTVGRLLAVAMRRSFVDVDREIEARAGRSIDVIFAESGEPEFREWEERTLAEVLDGFPEAVVATGGGSVLRQRNRDRIREFGHVVWLTALPDELAQRLAADKRSGLVRPSLTSAGLTEEIAEVLRVRVPIYEGLADVVIETGGKSPEEVAAEVLERSVRWGRF
jgi:shikimate kinase